VPHLLLRKSTEKRKELKLQPISSKRTSSRYLPTKTVKLGFSTESKPTVGGNHRHPEIVEETL
jgi:hypothetical protein